MFVFGIGMNLGLRVVFVEVNVVGGVYGCMIEIISMDDGYELDWFIVVVNKLINEDKVFGLIGLVGILIFKVI